MTLTLNLEFLRRRDDFFFLFQSQFYYARREAHYLWENKSFLLYSPCLPARCFLQITLFLVAIYNISVALIGSFAYYDPQYLPYLHT